MRTVGTFICIYIHIRTYAVRLYLCLMSTCIYLSMHSYTCIHTYVYMCIHTCACIYVYICMHVCNYMRVHAYLCMDMYMSVCTCVQLNTNYPDISYPEH